MAKKAKGRVAAMKGSYPKASNLKGGVTRTSGSGTKVAVAKSRRGH